MPVPIFWRFNAPLVAGFGSTEVIVLSAVFVPPRTSVLVLAATVENVPLRVNAPAPLALMKALAVVVLMLMFFARVAKPPV